MSQFKFDSEGDTPITEKASLFLKFYEHYEIDYDDVACILFFLTLEGRFNRWVSYPTTCFHSSFDRYNYQDVLKRINQLRMEPNESIDDLFN